MQNGKANDTNYLVAMFNIFKAKIYLFFFALQTSILGLHIFIFDI